MPTQNGLLHTWNHLHTTMKAGLHRFLAPDSKLSLKLHHVHLPSFFGQIADRGRYIEAALKARFLARYDSRLPLVIRGNALLLRLAVSAILDYAMDRHPGVGYTEFAINLAEENSQDYVAFDVWHTGIYKGSKDGVRSWYNHNEIKRFAERMGGFFFTKEPHGAESRYGIRIPMILGDPSTAAHNLPATFTKLTQAKNGATALVVDDSPISRALGQYLLARHNIAVDTAANGKTALAMLAYNSYDLIFMDYSMPGLNGIQTILSARERQILQTGFVIGMSSAPTLAKNMKAAFIKAGMQGYLRKPVDLLELNLLLLDLLPCLHGQFSSDTPEQTDAPQPIDTPQKRLLQTLSGIAGLDAEKGLANAGHNIEIYTGMLHRYTVELTDYIDPLLTLSSDSSWKEAATRLHVLRNFFTAIGAESLAQEASTLITLADAGGGSMYMPRIHRHCDAMMRLRAGLLALKAEHSGEIKAAEPPEPRKIRTEPADLPKLKRYVARLHEACLSHSATAAQRTADDLRRIVLPESMEEKIENICALVDNLEYREAHERCAQLLEEIEGYKFGTTT